MPPFARISEFACTSHVILNEHTRNSPINFRTIVNKLARFVTGGRFVFILGGVIAGGILYYSCTSRAGHLQNNFSLFFLFHLTKN